jgi:Glycosyl transferase family 2
VSVLDSKPPCLSVVVVAVYEPYHLARCLATLSKQINPPEMEIIVVYHENAGDISALREKFATVQFCGATGALTQARMLTLGIRQARGEIIALTVDHCTPENDWCARIADAHKGPYAAIGGALEKGDQADTAVNWAVHLYDYCSYGYYQKPVRLGPALELSDCNVSYKRKALSSISERWLEEFHVPLINRALSDSGKTLWFSPDLLVYQHRSVEWRRAARIAFARGRAFASARMRKFSLAKRMIYICFCPVLPVKQMGKLILNMTRKKSHLSGGIRALPFILVFSTLWSWGELIGLLAGRVSYTITITEE